MHSTRSSMNGKMSFQVKRRNTAMQLGYNRSHPFIEILWDDSSRGSNNTLSFFAYDSVQNEPLVPRQVTHSALAHRGGAALPVISTVHRHHAQIFKASRNYLLIRQAQLVLPFLILRDLDRVRI